MPRQNPNILHLFTDMQRWDSVGAYGNAVVRTPNLDALAADGVLFTSAYTPSPVCIAARCSMIHGRYPHGTGCYENELMPTDGRLSVMDALARAGYRTHGIGKCHFTPDPFALRGFQSREFQEEGGSAPEDLERNHYLCYLRDRGYSHICEPHGVRGEMYYIPQPSQLPWRDHPTQWVGDRAVAFIEEPSRSREPWYLFASFIHPHPPFTPPNPWHKLYRPALMDLPNVPPDAARLHTIINSIQNRYKYRDAGRDLHLVRATRAYYYACVSFVDYQVGRIVQALRDAGALDDTLIVFTSDHGEYLGDYDCYGKRSMHDPSSRVPLIARLPGRFEGGLRCDAPASLVDLAPTFLSLSGGTLGSQALDGVDLAEVAAGTSRREAVFSELSWRGFLRGFPGLVKDTAPAGAEFSPDQVRARTFISMAVTRRWKYFYSAGDERELLFDRVHDPRETRNRRGVRFCADELARMKALLIEHLTAGGETSGIDGSDWRRFPTFEVSDDPDTGLLIQDMYTPWADMRLPL